MKSCATAADVKEKFTDSTSSPQAGAPRICLLTETFYPVVGGGETHARLLARHLSLLGAGVFVVTRRSDSRFPRFESVDGIPTYRLPPSGMKRLGKYAMLPFAFIELIRRRRDWDLILVCGFRTLGVPAVVAARFLGKACVLRAEAQGEISGGYASAYRNLPPVIGPIFRWWIGLRNLILRNADAFVSISAPIAKEFARCGADISRIFELPNGVVTEQFHPADAETKSSLREKLRLPQNAVVVVYSGKLNKGKGLEYLLRAWRDVSASRQDALLTLIGSGGGQTLSCEDELRRMTREMSLESKVIFTGYVENVHEYLQAADLFVLPSENEGLPMCLLEAMSCRLPSVATKVGGIPEVIRHMENGILVEPADTDALAREMIRLMESPSLAESLAAEGRNTICERYSIQVVSSRYLELFSWLCARKAQADYGGPDATPTD